MPHDAGLPRSIVSITSVNGELASLNRGEYCISKAGASMLTGLFTLRLAPHGIGGFEIRPSIIRTPMTAPVAERHEQAIAAASPRSPRWGEPADVGRAVATAAGQLPFSAGQVIHVDGGLSLPSFRATDTTPDGFSFVAALVTGWLQHYAKPLATRIGQKSSIIHPKRLELGSIVRREPAKVGSDF